MNSLNETIMIVTTVTAFLAALTVITFILAKYIYLTKKTYADTGQKPTPITNKFIFQDIACIVVALGIGLGLSAILSVLNLAEITRELLIYGMVSFWLGLGLFTAQWLRKRANKS